MNTKPRLSDQLRHQLRIKHYSYQTKKSYVNCVSRFFLFHKKRPLQKMSTPEVKTYLTHLAVDRHVAASTQNQALNALVFFYKYMIKMELGVIDAMRAHRPKRLPVVLSQEETKKILAHLSGIQLLMVRLLYGKGLRLIECHRLRIKDIDFSANHIFVRSCKGFKGRVTILPQ